MNKSLLSQRSIELLAPAKNVDMAIEAINHGADAVYIGASSHGARQSASNNIDEIKRLTEYAHQFNAKVYTTVNTIVYNKELRQVERLIKDLYKANVDALIVQDMGILRMDIPPIQLHASTQCDNRTVEKAKFLESVGFSQIVLARELTIDEISEICRSVSIPVETFIHGALCVSYSGRCHASMATRGRSANRGECAQLCRLPYTLKDRNYKTIIKDRHLLSLKDFNLSDRVSQLMEAGVRSFKIEGRLKDATYVKNVVAYYRGIIDREIEQHPEKYKKASIGSCEYMFEPQLKKSFNRGFTHYFINMRRHQNSMASIYTPKSLGEEITDYSDINNGDGVSFFNQKGEYTGFRVNRVVGNKIVPAQPINIPRGTVLYRTFDVQWEKLMAKPTSVRKIDVDIKIDENGVSIKDESGRYIRIALDVTKDVAQKPMNLKSVFEKLGNTPFRLRNFDSRLKSETFIPMSQLTELRRKLVVGLSQLIKTSYHYSYRDKEERLAKYPQIMLDYRDNVANSLAEVFYRSHGVNKIEKAMEIDMQIHSEMVVMTCRYCILRELGMCKRDNPEKIKNYREPLTIESGDVKFDLRFDCRNCEMQIIKK